MDIKIIDLTSGNESSSYDALRKSYVRVEHFEVKILFCETSRNGYLNNFLGNRNHFISFTK